MAFTNQYYSFAAAGGSNRLTNSAYSSLPARLTGFVSGTALSVQLNTVWAQSANMSAALGQLIADFGGTNANDDGNIPVLEAALVAGIKGAVSTQVQSTQWNYGVDTGVHDAAVVTLNPVPPAFPPGMTIVVKFAAANTGSTPTITVNGTTFNLKRNDGSNPAPGDFQGDMVITCDTGLVFKAIGLVVSQVLGSNYGPDSGTTNNLAVTLTPAPTGYFPGMVVRTTLNATITGPAVINVNGLGNKAITNQGGGLLYNLDYLAGDPLAFQYTGSAFISINPVNKAIIDTALSYQVYGAGAAFTDLNQAFTWLGRRRITPTGSVTFTIPAGQFIHSTTNVNIAHPDLARVSIKGQASSSYTLVATAPHAAGDGATNLTNMRAAFPTEIRFTGGYNMNIYGGCGVMQDILITSDGTNTAGTGNNGLTLYGLGASPAVLKNIAIHGFWGYGLLVQEGTSVALDGTFGCAYCCNGATAIGNVTVGYGAHLFCSTTMPTGLNTVGSGSNGMVIIAGASVEMQNTNFTGSGNSACGLNVQEGMYHSLSGSLTYTLNNGQHGVFAQQGSIYSAGTITTTGNSQAGIYCDMGNIRGNSTANIQNNGNWGIYCYQGNIWINGTATLAANTNGPMYGYGSGMNRVGPSSTGTASASPVVGTVGNGNFLNIAA